MREHSFGVGAGLEQVLPPTQLQRLSDAGTPGQRKRGECVFHQGDPAEAVLVLLAGKVKMTLVNAAGQEILIRIHLPGSLLGLTALGSRQVRELTATALEEIAFTAIPRQRFIDLMESDATLGLFLSRLLIDRLTSLHYRLGEEPGMTVEQRLAHALIVLARPDETETIDVPQLSVALTHEELASIVNARRQTVTETLGRFVKAGYIRMHKRQIVIARADGLASLLPEPLKTLPTMLAGMSAG